MRAVEAIKWLALILFISLLANIPVYALMYADLTRPHVHLDNWPAIAVPFLSGAIAAILGRQYG